MNLQRRIAEARRVSLIRSVGRRPGLTRWLRHSRPAAVHDAAALKPVPEDFGHAIRF